MLSAFVGSTYFYFLAQPMAVSAMERAAAFSHSKCALPRFSRSEEPFAGGSNGDTNRSRPSAQRSRSRPCGLKYRPIPSARNEITLPPRSIASSRASLSRALIQAPAITAPRSAFSAISYCHGASLDAPFPASAENVASGRSDERYHVHRPCRVVPAVKPFVSAALHAGDSTISICVAQWSNVDKKGDGMSPPGRRQVARNSTDPPYSEKPWSLPIF